jgi:SAM-dependent methyltransferase
MSVRSLLLQRRGDYGYDAPRQGLMPTGGGGVLFACLSAFHRRAGHTRIALLELATSMFLFAWFSMYLHTTRRGKFLAWAEILADLQLRGDEQVLDMGCGRGGVMAMVAKLLPRGRVVGLDLWTEDQSGNRPETTRLNLELEGVQDRCELKTGDMLAMPLPNDRFDLVVSSMAIHNIDENNIRNHTRRFQALDEAVRVLKPGGRLVVADFWSGAYAQHLLDEGMLGVHQRSLGWRFWYLPGFGAGLVTATKPEVRSALAATE